MQGRQKQKRRQSRFNFRLAPHFLRLDYQRFAAQGFLLAHGFILAAHGFVFIAHGFIFALQGLFAAHGLALKPFCSDAL